MSFYTLSYLIPSIIYFLSFNKIKDFFLLDERDKINLFFLGIFSSILGGRIGYVLLYNLAYYLNNPLDIFKIWYGGMSFHGGLIFMLLSLYLYARQFNKTFFSLTALFSLFTCIGIFIGRISNFINNELYGIAYDGIFSVNMLINQSLQTRFPSQLLEAFLEGFILFSIIFLLIKKKKSHFFISISFLLFYSIFRIIAEFFRSPDAHIGYLYPYVTLGMIFSMIFLFLGFMLIAHKLYNNF